MQGKYFYDDVVRSGGEVRKFYCVISLSTYQFVSAVIVRHGLEVHQNTENERDIIIQPYLKKSAPRN